MGLESAGGDGYDNFSFEIETASYVNFQKDGGPLGGYWQVDDFQQDFKNDKSYFLEAGLHTVKIAGGGMAIPYTISISLLGNDTYFLDVGGEINEEGGGGSDTVVLSDELIAQTSSIYFDNSNLIFENALGDQIANIVGQAEYESAIEFIEYGDKEFSLHSLARYNETVFNIFSTKLSENGEIEYKQITSVDEESGHSMHSPQVTQSNDGEYYVISFLLQMFQISTIMKQIAKW